MLYKKSYKTAYVICKLLTKSHLGGTGAVESQGILAASLSILP